MKKNEYKADGKLEARIAFILMKAGVTGPQIDECMDWAFGPGAWYVPPYPDWLERWRKLHPEYTVKKNESFVEWIFVIGHLFSNLQRIKEEHNKKYWDLN